jgi:DNA repair protein RecO (recombination protein O)
MEWTDEGIVLGTRRHGEASVVLEVMTRGHGRHAGLVRGGKSARLRPVLQAGNTVSVTWRARLDEHLGNFAVEGLTLRASRFIDVPMALCALSTITELTRLLPERDPYPELHDALNVLIAHLDDPAICPILVVRYELELLRELGFGLDLGTCAATGSNDDLIYVSPRTARAVSASAGEPYRDRLLALPGFLAGRTSLAPTHSDIAAGFALTGYFLNRNVYEPRGTLLPEARERLIAMMMR